MPPDYANTSRAPSFEKRVAITGGRGRLSPVIASHLAALGWEVVSFSRTPSQDFQDIKDLCDPGTLSSFGAILHVGWSSVPLLSEQDPGIEEREDFPFLQRLLSGMANAAKQPRLTFFSSAAVYGNTEAAPATENCKCNPIGRYAAAKLAAEKLILSAPNLTAPPCILRISNIFGFSLRSEKHQGVIPYLYHSALTGSRVKIWGDGSSTKDYIFYTDFLGAIQSVLVEKLSGIFNVASGKSLSLRQIIKLIEDATARPIEIENVAHYPWDVEYSHLSADKLSNTSGWRREQDIEAAIGDGTHFGDYGKGMPSKPPAR